MKQVTYLWKMSFGNSMYCSFVICMRLCPCTGSQELNFTLIFAKVSLSRDTLKSCVHLFYCICVYDLKMWALSMVLSIGNKKQFTCTSTSIFKSDIFISKAVQYYFDADAEPILIHDRALHLDGVCVTRRCAIVTWRNSRMSSWNPSTVRTQRTYPYSVFW